MKSIKNILSTRYGIIAAGIIIGLVAIVLQINGNPANMAICVACFIRDCAGALGFHRAEPVQYLRPEIIGLAAGAAFAAVITREFRPRGGSSTLTRFALGFFAVSGALIFLGCPWRAVLRLAGGDLNAVTGIAGLAAGIFAGTLFMRRGYSLGRSTTQKKSTSLVFILIVIGLFALALGSQFFGITPPFVSLKGPGSQHAPFALSLAGGVIIGVIAQRSRFCTVGAFRDIFILRELHLFKGILFFFLTVLVFNLLTGRFHAGFENQPIAHNQHVWNFLGMLLAGLSFTLAGGCPGRQVVLAGEGDNDSAVFVLGMVAGAAAAHNFQFAAGPAGIGAYSPVVLVIGLVFVTALGFFSKEAAQ